MYRNWNSGAPLVERSNGTVVENSMGVPHKLKNGITILSCNFTAWHISKITESRVLKKYLYIHVKSSFNYTTKNVESTQMFINQWINKQNVIYACNEILFSMKKGKYAGILYSMYEPWGHYLSEVNSYKYCMTSLIKDLNLTFVAIIFFILKMNTNTLCFFGAL